MATQTRKPTAERREEIVAAVLRIIGEQGLTSLTTKTLATEVGVTTGALFRHFESREAILDAVVDHALVAIEETFPDATLPAIERLRRIAANRVRLLGSNPGLAWLLRSEQAFLTLPTNAVAQLRKLVQRSKRYLLRALREAAADGSVRTDIAPEVLLVPLMGTVHTLVGMSGAHGAAKNRRGKTESVLDALFAMLAPPPGVQKPKRRSPDVPDR